MRGSKIWLLVMFLAALIVFFFFLPNKEDEEQQQQQRIPNKNQRHHEPSRWNTRTAVKQRKKPAKVHRELLHGVEVLWQAPGNQEGEEDAAQSCGILVVLHGCHHSATDFWSNDSAAVCQGECLGLPEERAIVQMGLERRLIVVALSSQNRKSKCWKPHRDNEPVAKVLMELQQRWSGGGATTDKPNNQGTPPSTLLPIIAFGASSGGGLVTQLDAALEAAGGRLDAFIAEIARGETQYGQHTRCGVYITMNRDEFVDQSVKETVKTIQNDKDNTHFAIKHIRLSDLPLHDSYFSDRIGSYSYTPAWSRRMVNALRKEGHLDAENKLLEDPGIVGHLEAEETRLKDPGKVDGWESTLRPFVPALQDSFEKDKSPIREVLRVAYGKHEMTRDGVAEALDFCLPKLERAPLCT